MAPQSAEALLHQAQTAQTPMLRAKYATSGLSQPRLSGDTQALLLRQLYLSHLERGRYEDAKAVAEQMVAVALLGDVALHDAARACLSLGQVSEAARHLRAASRSGPPSRRAFHLSCLGSLYANTGHLDKAVTCLRRAVRWATEDRALYRAQLALALHHNGSVVDLSQAFAVLNGSRRRGGYADFVLGELALALGQRPVASDRLRAFVARVEASSVSIRAGLRHELERAKKLLAELSRHET
jgi:tetratricopeptide (TPR) repeat protein